jgi:hypothetical protein
MSDAPDEPPLTTSGASHEQSTRAMPPEFLGICRVSSDKTYGYAVENAIKLGGDFLAGPDRQVEYLRLLRGPAGEGVTFKRRGSSSSSDQTIIDVYELAYPGLDKPIVLYLNEYAWSPPMVPAGLTCSGPIQLKEP